jgi:hypothetical protein
MGGTMETKQQIEKVRQILVRALMEGGLLRERVNAAIAASGGKSVSEIHAAVIAEAERVG